MLITTVTQYLGSHKRLVIPQLGTFIVKEPGRSILFSELLKRDDGVLRGLLRERGLGELEAAGEIDRFVFEVRHAVERGGEYRMEGFGVLKPGPNATISFVYDPRPAEQPAAGRSAEDGGQEAAGSAGHAPSRPSRLHSEKVAEAVRTAFTEPHVSTSAKMNPDPSVRGLRYGKPPKSTDAYTYVDRVPRRRGDWFIWIGLFVAILALGAIAYGLWNDAREQQAATEYIELPALAPADDPSVPESAAPASTEQPEQPE